MSFSLGFTKSCQDKQHLRTHSSHMNAHHARGRMWIDQGERVCSSFKIEITAICFHKTAYKPYDLKTLAVHCCSPPSKKTTWEMWRSPSHQHLRAWSTVEEAWWEIKQLPRKSQINHFTSINYLFPGCSFHLLPISKETVVSNPSPFSPSLCLCWEYPVHAAIPLPVVTTACLGSLGPARAARCTRIQETCPQPGQPATQRLLTTLTSLDMARTISHVWLHK